MSETNATYAQLAVENLELANLAANRLNTIRELESRVASTYQANDLLLAMQNALLTNTQFIDALVATLADHKSFNQRSAIDYGSLVRELELDTLAETIAGCFDSGDIAEWINIDYDDLSRHISYTDLACELDYSDLAANINYEDTIDEVVREKLEDLQLKNCNITFS